MQLEKKKDEQRGAVNSILGQVLKEKLRAISQMQKKETPLELGIQRIVKPRALNESISKKSIKSRSIGLNRAKISKSKTIIRQLGQASYDASTFIRNKLLGGSTQQTE